LRQNIERKEEVKMAKKLQVKERLQIRVEEKRPLISKRKYRAPSCACYGCGHRRK